jgi:hypothetical protein
MEKQPLVIVHCSVILHTVNENYMYMSVHNVQCVPQSGTFIDILVSQAS